jgi:hypothetical protein
MSRVVLFVALCAFVGCAADVQPSDAAAACSCSAELDMVEVSNCVPQADGSCADAGVHEGTLADVLAYVCNYTDTPDGIAVKPDVHCDRDTYTVSCRGATTHFHLVAGDAGECRAEVQP